MDAERDIKPFVSPILATTIQRKLHGPSACQPTALPLERGGTRVLPQTQPQAACVLNQAASELSGGISDRSISADEALEGTSARRPCSAPPPRLSRKFWGAGDYDAATGRSASQPPSLQNRMCVHPEFLHSNATSHKWPFGAMAELLDNAVDEIETGGATTILLDKVIDKRNGSPALLIQDGNGFKTSTMRLGADVIVFTRCTKSSGPTQSIGLLSYTFLVETGHTDVVIPMVDYKCNLMKGQTQRLEHHGSEQFSSNLSVLLKWSPFATEEELMQNFCDIGPHGTKIIVFNLWSNGDGNLELDFDTNPEDIMISGAPNPEEISNAVKRANENHLANRLRYSLRAEVLTTIGFLKGAPTISVHGFNIYHKNRLILPFHRVLSNASSKGRSVSGVLEVDFIKPTHDKQDFEKSQLFQRLINRLKEMTNEYWDLYSEKIGYVKMPRVSAAPTPPRPPPVMLPIANGAAEPSERSAPAPAPAPTQRLRSHGNYVNAVPIAFAPPGFHSAPVKTEAVAPGAPMGYSPSSSPNVQTMQVINQTKSPSMAPGTDSVETRKRRNDDATMTVALKRKVVEDLAGSSSATDQVSQYMGERELKEFKFMKLENRMLREECAEFEMAEKELRLKEQNLRLELEKAQEQFKSLLNEYVSLSAVPAKKR
uniref:Morc S5 domain-containing protein n=1 Tax=Saccharum hybrid cultivar R570 TaxID=131158 RepID=A0A059PZE4_9POAL|nr:hypothetical protein SHCRBa_190_D01_F_220 [Saccharum hybrid cultivar R570]